MFDSEKNILVKISNSDFVGIPVITFNLSIEKAEEMDLS